MNLLHRWIPVLLCNNVDVGVVDIFDKDKEGKRVRKQLEVDRKSVV